ncbi:hypothetical protein ACS3UN_06575 [Oscillospiraceae bacterium LTW-04]|nr:hypothetical protein RBH76_03785 [Oscillospiraceae bacterium MB24-C1]
MIFECSAIILVILIMSFMSLGKKSAWSIAMLPLLLVPAGHIAGLWLSEPIAGLLHITVVAAWIGIDLCVLTLTCVLLGIISLNIKSTRLRVGYLSVCGLFSALLTCVLIVRSVLTT